MTVSGAEALRAGFLRIRDFHIGLAGYFRFGCLTIPPFSLII